MSDVRTADMENEAQIIAVGDCFLFGDERDDAQGHIVIRFQQINDGCAVHFVPEWTPVRTPGMFMLGTKSVRLKYKK